MKSTHSFVAFLKNTMNVNQRRTDQADVDVATGNLGAKDIFVAFPRRILRADCRVGQFERGSVPPQPVALPPVCLRIDLAEMNASSSGSLSRFRVLICDRHAKWSEAIRGGLRDSGIRVIQPPFRAQNANASADRFVRSIKRNA
jgi:hypothetical protein